MSVEVHKAVEPGNLSTKGKKRFLALQHALFNGFRSEAILQPKHDGVYGQFIFDDREGWQAFSRTGQLLLSISDDIKDAFWSKAIQSRRYNGELWLPGTQHSVINGRARKQSAQHLEVVLFDSFDGTPETYVERQQYLFNSKLVYPVADLAVPELYVLDDLYDLARSYKNRTSAFDGIMLKDPNGLYYPGAGKDGETIKIKPRAEGDFRVVGTTAGEGNRAGGIGALVVDLGRGITTDVGSGLTLAQVMDPESPVGRIATIEYLSLTKDGRLREPSFKAYRFDKAEADVLGEDIGDD